jgi:hypothetical protein
MNIRDRREDAHGKSGGVLSLQVPLSTVLTIAVGIGLIWIVMRLWPQMSLGLWLPWAVVP